MTIRLYVLPDGLGDVAPQAIFWRPLEYFTTAVRKSEDDLDSYRVATFEIGNWLRFDIRKYQGHPDNTTTLYFSVAMDDPKDIRYSIARVIGEFELPLIAVAWRRGEQFEYGALRRRQQDRLREPEARLLALKIAALAPDHRATTDELIRRAPQFFSPSELDERPSRTRPMQPQWHQIIRNVISHRHVPHGPFEMGFAVRTADGLAVTDEGVNHLRALGFLA